MFNTIWHFCPAEILWPQLWKHRKSIPVQRYPFILGVLIASLLASLWAFLGRINEKGGEKKRRVPPLPAPVFILGYWRSGTTYLHELMQQDPRVLVPTTAHCVFPQYFKMVSGGARKYFANVADIRGDGIDVGWQSAQEDEFALMLLGAPTPYWWFGFPTDEATSSEEVVISALAADDRLRWSETVQRFLHSCWLYKETRQTEIVLKSPPHTARIDTLLDMYPEAKFIHISRDPVEIHKSFCRFMPELAENLSMIGPPAEEARGALQARAMEEFASTYEHYAKTREMIPAGNLLEIRFDTLRSDPEATIALIYDWLGWPLEDAEGIFRAQLAARIEGKRSHKPKTRGDDSTLRAELAAKAPWYFRQFGYPEK